MKTKILISCITLVLLLVISCYPKDDNVPGSSSAEFIGFYSPNLDQVAGGSPGLVMFSQIDGNTQYNFKYSFYPYENLYKNSVVRNNRMAIGLHNDFKQDYSLMGSSFGLDDADQYYLPLIPPDEEDDYSTFDVASPKLSDNGFVFYISATHDKNYADQYRPNLVRYNLETDYYESASAPHSFTLAQPEKKGDTEGGLFDKYFVAGADGRYVYGTLIANGVDFGVYHEDYKFIFRYDFENGEYTRIGDGHSWVTLYGMTSDGKYLVYKSWNGTENKMYIYNTQSGTIAERPYYFDEVRRNPASWNDKGFCIGGDKYTSSKIYYCNVVDDDYPIVVELGDRARITQFSPNGDFIYFCIYGADENYMCKTSGLETGSTIDTLFAYSKEIIDYLVIY